MAVSSSFQENVKKFVSIDNKIKSAQEAIRILKKEKDDAAKNIMLYIETNNLEDTPINISDGKLKMVTSKRTVTVTQKYIEQRLTEYFGSSNKAREVMSFIYDNRESVETTALKRTKNRK